MQLLQFSFVGDTGQALEEWERLVRQCEEQSSDTLQDTIQAAILAHNPQSMVEARWSERDEAARVRCSEKWKAIHLAYRRWDGNDTSPMEVDALMQGKGENKGKGKGRDQGKDKGRGKSKDNAKEGKSDMSIVKCF